MTPTVLGMPKVPQPGHGRNAIEPPPPPACAFTPFAGSDSNSASPSAPASCALKEKDTTVFCVLTRSLDQETPFRSP
eukprot:CAMPEP_0184374338 /NCGR_PEP_ID=MMETSP1089-20130417/164972_1 /TAXON_ID=38269 ORGANISM="Gloeochaete wittrockiana, Strain SAG46.84" /NCGR_SAMPLE_ID=MMETSP1089 /ASSEMBLY_ACC=CAM_ASM_000445 /LENGTH=76 /DNA_ID=CAMNT_0026717349 /DNA_START=1175 /DNA_END=1405 /DNA_ORIENTATION=-